MKKDMISVIVPVYNSAEYLEHCLDSILNQTYKELEVICINDGSTDCSEQILHMYEAKDSRVIVESIPNAGQANARNIGMDIARGEYICFVDSDDVIDLQMIEELYCAIQGNYLDMVFCYIRRIYEKKPSLLERFYKFDLTFDFTESTTIYEHPELICYLTNGPVAKLYKRSFLNQHHIRFIKGYIYEDLLFTQEILSCNPTIAKVDAQLYDYIIHQNSTMTSKRSNVTDMFVTYKNVYDAYECKQIAKQFKNELDYLCLYHVMIGTSYRMWRSGQYGLLKSIRICRKYVRQYECSKENEYIKAKGVLSRLFIRFIL